MDCSKYAEMITFTRLLRVYYGGDMNYAASMVRYYVYVALILLVHD